MDSCGSEKGPVTCLCEHAN